MLVKEIRSYVWTKYIKIGKNNLISEIEQRIEVAK